MDSNPALARELAESAKALRKLARDLIGPTDADDLVQETMLRAWRNPPTMTRGLLPWLATVLRNLASNHRRDQKRRQDVANELPEHLATASDSRHGSGGSEQSPMRSVTEALWRLPEPYQATLTQRYFGGQSPKQIAQRTNTPIATVKSRLQRGLTMLRRELNRGHGGSWRSALLIAAGLRLPATVPTATATTTHLLLMAHATKLLMFVGASGVAALLYFALRSPDAPLPTQSSKATETPPAANATASDASHTTAERTALQSEGGDSGINLDHDYAFQLRCRVRDRDGLIVRGIQVAIAPRNSSLNAWSERTDATGEVLIEWRGKSPIMKMWVGLSRGLNSQVLQEVEVRSGQIVEVGLLDSTGGAAGMCGMALSASMDCRACHLASQQSKLFDLRLRAKQRLHPQTTLASLLLGDTGARFGVAPPTETSGDLPQGMDTPPAPPTTGVAGIVRDRNGQPISGATVIWSKQQDLPMGRTVTDSDGKYKMPLRREGMIEVRAGGGPYGIARAQVRVVPDKRVTCDLFLDPGRTLTGRVLLPKGEKPSSCRVEYLSQDVSWVDGVNVRPDGRFILANLPTHSGSILLWTGNSRLPAAIEAYAATETEVVFDLRELRMPKGSLRMQALQTEDDVERHCEAFAFQLETARGSIMPRKQDGSFELGGLPAGFYRVALIGSPFGQLDLGEHWVDGQSVVDLGSHRLPDPGLLRVPDRNLAENLELYLRRPDMDVCATPVAGRQTEFLVPAGDWLMMWGDQDAPQVRTFSVQANETVTMSIAR